MHALLLSVSRADRNGTARPPGILARGSSRRPSLPMQMSAQWPPARPAVGRELPAYSGGTAWDSHPLRMAAGLSQFAVEYSRAVATGAVQWLKAFAVKSALSAAG